MHEDLLRILALPTKPPLPELVQQMTEALRLHADAPPLTTEQAEVLFWATAMGGGASNQSVGGGKTLVALLLPFVLGARRPLLVVPPGLEASAIEQYHTWKHHYPVVLPRILTYQVLSAKDGEAQLRAVAPDLVVLDEAHNLALVDSARTRRWNRFVADNPNTNIIVMSGTLVGRNPRRYAHLFASALMENSPAPLEPDLCESWAVCMVEKGQPSQTDLFLMEQLQEWANEPDPHKAVNVRLGASPGVVLSTRQPCDASLHLALHHVRPPPDLDAMANRVEETWELPDGEPIIDAARMAMHLQNLALGFHYRWTEQPPPGWLEARREWSRELRNICLYRDRPGFDTPATVRATLEASEWAQQHNRSAWEALCYWKDYESWPVPPTEAVWLDGGAHLERCVARLLEAQEGEARGPLLWYRSHAVGARLAGLGLDVRGQGARPPAGESAACSIRVFGTGHRLHMYQRAGVLELPLDPVAWQQLLGRLHRRGQESDTVVFDVLQSGQRQAAVLHRARAMALADQNTSGDPHRLVFATQGVATKGDKIKTGVKNRAR